MSGSKASDHAAMTRDDAGDASRLTGDQNHCGPVPEAVEILADGKSDELSAVVVQPFVPNQLREILVHRGELHRWRLVRTN